MELLVVIAIIGVLVGLLLPAVQAARESARRSRCQSNMRQIGLAFTNCADARRYYPAAMYSKDSASTSLFPTPPEGNSSRKEHSWRVLVMPFMEEQSAIDAYDWKKNWYDITSNSTPASPNDATLGVPPDCNLAVGTRPVPLYVCTSTPPRIVGSTTVADSPDTGDSARTSRPPKLSSMAFSDYDAVTGVSDKVVSPERYPKDSFEAMGLLSKDSVTRARQVSDGLSKTLLIVEDAGKPNLYRAGKMATNPFGPLIPQAGISWADNLGPFKIDGFTADGTNQAAAGAGLPMNATNSSWPKGGGECYSFHPGGINVVFGDSSTRFISETIDITTFCALVTRAGGEIAGEVP